MFLMSMMYIGGDYFDVLKVDECYWVFVIVDVLGKGVGVVLMMVECWVILWLCVVGELSLVIVIWWLNWVI